MNQLTTIQPTAPRTYTGSQLSLIRRTVAKDTTNDEFDLFIEVCRRAGFDPFRKQIYCFVFNKDKPDRRQMAIVTGIDGYRSVAARSGAYRPDNKPARITYDEAEKSETNPLGIVSAEVSVFRFAHGDWFETEAIAYWEEFAPVAEIWEYDPEKNKRVPTGKFKLEKDSWRKMPRIMISKCAEAQALRKGWPEELSGIYSEEEMDRARAEDRSATEMAEMAEREHREALIHAKDAVPIQWAAGEEIVYEPIGGLADKVLAVASLMKSPAQLTAWREINRAGFNQFWAAHKADALELKVALDKRMVELEKALEDDDGQM